jgi:hypothetical protein
VKPSLLKHIVQTLRQCLTPSSGGEFDAVLAQVDESISASQHDVEKTRTLIEKSQRLLEQARRLNSLC